MHEYVDMIHGESGSRDRLTSCDYQFRNSIFSEHSQWYPRRLPRDSWVWLNVGERRLTILFTMWSCFGRLTINREVKWHYLRPLQQSRSQCVSDLKSEYIISSYIHIIRRIFTCSLKNVCQSFCYCASLQAGRWDSLQTINKRRRDVLA